MNPPAEQPSAGQHTPGVGLVLAAALGGAVGAGVRHLVGLPLSGVEALVVSGVEALVALTLAINVAGSFALALLPLIDVIRREPWWRVAAGPGLLGGFTTLSAVNEQTRGLLADGRLGLAGGYLVGSAIVCVAAAALGAALVQRRIGKAGA